MAYANYSLDQNALFSESDTQAHGYKVTAANKSEQDAVFLKDMTAWIPKAPAMPEASAPVLKAPSKNSIHDRKHIADPLRNR